MSLNLITETATHVTSVGDYGLIIAIFFLVPLFCIKFARTSFPIVYCAQTDLHGEDAEKCEHDRRVQMDYQYMSVLVMGVIVIVIAYALYLYKLTSKSACLGLIYGAMATLVYAVYSNLNRLTNHAQMSIVGLLIVSAIFLPPLTNNVLLC